MSDQQPTPPADTATPARTVARQRLQDLGLTEAEAVAVVLPVIAEAYRDVADDAADGASGELWGTTPEEALTAFAAAYRQVAASLDLIGAPMPDTSPALAREKAAHEEHRLALSEALHLGTGAPWDAITERAVEVQGDVRRLGQSYTGRPISKAVNAGGRQ